MSGRAPVRLGTFSKVPETSSIEVALVGPLGAVARWFRYRGVSGFVALAIGWVFVIWRSAVAGYLSTVLVLLPVLAVILVQRNRRMAREDEDRLAAFLRSDQRVICSVRNYVALREIVGQKFDFDRATGAHLLVDEDGHLELLFVDMEVRKIGSVETVEDMWRLEARVSGSVVGVSLRQNGRSTDLLYPHGNLGRFVG